MPTQRYKLVVAYRGTRYHGWQTQPVHATFKGERPPEGEGLPTIQDLLNRTIASVVGHPLKVVGSSRTDAGVHAKAQVCHFDTDQTQIPVEGMRRAVNHRLPDDVLVRSIEPVSDEFDAIRSTLGKRYQYAIWNAPDRPLFFADLIWHRWQKLDVDAMRAAAAFLVGEHDFASFAKPGHGRENTIRRVRECSISYRPPRMVFGLEGSGFLWNMVRISVGTLVEVGLGRYTPADVAAMLVEKDRRSAGSTAPPHGLYLHWVRSDATGQPTPDGRPAVEPASKIPMVGQT